MLFVPQTNEPMREICRFVYSLFAYSLFLIDSRHVSDRRVRMVSLRSTSVWWTQTYHDALTLKNLPHTLDQLRLAASPGMTPRSLGINGSAPLASSV